MDEDLISKKDLLDVTGISYGQLYRWKRKNIIPEEWFIKKSSFTGQETYFPRQKILERVEKIKNMKDDSSLDDLAQFFSPELSDIKLSEEALKEKNIVVKDVLDIYKEYKPDRNIYSFNEIVYMSLLQKFLISGSISIDEVKIILETLDENYGKYAGKDFEIIFIRKMGIGICILTLTKNQLYFESLAKLIMKINITECIEELKLKMKELF